MSTIYMLHTEKPSIRPATGLHLELLVEAEEAAIALLRLIHLERSGTYDGFGTGFWTGSDSALNMAEKIVRLLQQRVGLPRQ
jgi:hypothetical protein